MFAEIFEYNMLCFHLSLFNFQSAICCLFFRDLQPRRDSLTIISHLFHFVKYFFKISWSFFNFLFFVPAVFLTARLLYHKLSGLSRGFAKVFWVFFKRFLRFNDRGLFFSFFFCRPSDSSVIITLNIRFVNPFLSSSPFWTS